MHNALNSGWNSFCNITDWKQLNQLHARLGLHILQIAVDQRTSRIRIKVVNMLQGSVSGHRWHGPRRRRRFINDLSQNREHCGACNQLPSVLNEILLYFLWKI